MSIHRCDVSLGRDRKRQELGPKSFNNLRGFLHSAFSAAEEAGKYGGPNPVTKVKRRKVPERAPMFLEAWEADRLLQMYPLKEIWRRLFATALFTGLRKGELLGLKKTDDVHRERRQIVVARSYDHRTTKSKKERIVPIAEALIPYLDAAIEASPSEYVFPGPDGKMMPQDTKVEVILRRALGRAGVVTGYRHSCRRCKARGLADSAQLATGAAPRKCSRCDMQMWCKPIPRPLRFHDMRDTTATLILAHGGTLWEVQNTPRAQRPHHHGQGLRAPRTWVPREWGQPASPWQARGSQRRERRTASAELWSAGGQQHAVGLKS